MGGLFPGFEADVQEATIEEIVNAHKALASAELITTLSQHRSQKFGDVVDRLLQPYMLRETNVEDICIELAKAGKVENTWGGGNRKPRDEDIIRERRS